MDVVDGSVADRSALAGTVPGPSTARGRELRMLLDFSLSILANLATAAIVAVAAIGLAR